MSFEALTRLVAPPVEPRDADGHWPEVEALLGVPLPADYKWFIETYGSGSIGGELRVLNPFSGWNEWQLGWQLLRCTVLLQELQGRNIGVPYGATSLFGEGRLLPCGLSNGGDVLFWIALGPSETWTMAVLRNARSAVASSAADFDEFKTGLVEFIAGACREGAGIASLRGASSFVGTDARTLKP